MIVGEPQPTGRLVISALEENLERLSRQLVDLPSSLRCRALLQSKTTSQKLTVFRSAANSSAAFQSGRLGYVRLASARYANDDCGQCDRNGNLSSRLRAGSLWQARFDQAKPRQYPQTVARKSAIRLRPERLGDRAGQQHQDHLRSNRRRARCETSERPGGNTTRRTSWPRASGPSSRITGAEPACTASACGCAHVPGARSCPVGAARAAARSLPDRSTRSSSGASRTQPHDAVN